MDALTTPATNNTDPILVVKNAEYEQQVIFQRQMKQGQNEHEQPWLPVELVRTGPLTFIDTQRPPALGGAFQAKLLPPVLKGFAHDDRTLGWCATFYSVSFANTTAWSTWSEVVASQTESYPLLSVPSGVAQADLVFRRTQNPKKDPVGEIIALVPTEQLDTFMDVRPPCAVCVVTSQNNTFYVALNEDTSAAQSWHFRVAPGSYHLDDLLSEIASQLSAHLGLSTVFLDFGRVNVHLEVPQPGVNTFTGLTYRVRTSSSTDVLSPNVSNGSSLNTLLGFGPETAPTSCVAGDACSQQAPDYPKLEQKAPPL
jgi:hypothetical protein